MVEWTGATYADTPTVEVSTWIAAPPERVWELVSDVAAMPGMSSELQAITWVGDATGPALGARFEGHNRHKAIGEWTAPAEIVEFEPPRLFGWAVGDPLRPSASWRFRLESSGGGTRLSQWVRLGPGRSGLSAAIDAMPDKEQKIVFNRLREFEANMTATVAAVKEKAEA